MNTARNDARQSNAFVERALARINELREIAQDLTDALGLPEEACYAVLSGMTPTLIEEIYQDAQGMVASPSSQDISTEEIHGSE
jgi:hypothetical protein